MKIKDLIKKVKEEIELGNTREAIIILINNFREFDEPTLFSSSYYRIRRDYDIDLISEEIFYRGCNKINNGILNFLKIIEQRQTSVLGVENKINKSEIIKKSFLEKNYNEYKKKTFLENLFSFNINNRKNKSDVYLNAFLSMIDVYSEINKLHGFVNPTPEIIVHSGVEICSKLKIIYDNITNSFTSVSIKVIVKGKSSLDSEVITLCRDKKMHNKKKMNDIVVQHKIETNTAFSFILKAFLRNKTKDAYYFNNDLMAEKNYTNTSLSFKSYLTEGKKWELPYESEIVVPIIPLKKDAIMVGFLCLNCSNKNNFDKILDIKIMQSIADSLYYPLIDWLKKSSNNASTILSD